MAEVGFIFTAHSVRQTIAGLKIETRRVIKRENAPDPGHQWRECLCREIDPSDTPCEVCIARFGRPRALPGDVIWFKETWGLLDTDPKDGPEGATVFYRATDGDRRGLRYQLWRSPVLMPRWASRISCKVLRVRAEPLWAITELGAINEGTPAVRAPDGSVLRSGIEEYARLWDELHGNKRPWAQCGGLFVWVYRYERKEGAK